MGCQGGDTILVFYPHEHVIILRNLNLQYIKPVQKIKYLDTTKSFIPLNYPKHPDYQKAEAFLQQGRTGANRYDKAQDFATTPDQDSAFINAGNAYMKIGYDLQGHNCYELGYDGLTKSGVEVFPRRGTTPNHAFSENNNTGYARLVSVKE